MKITRRDIELAASDKGDVWTFGNNVLYRLCRDNPEHKRPEIVTAKVWLIGRSYAAAIERGRKQADSANPIPNDVFYREEVAPALISSDIDDRLNNLQQYDRISEQSISDILTMHKYLVGIFKELTGQRKRSLASKYLHFHRPSLFYIYDTRAVNGFRKIRPRCRVRHRNVESDSSDYAIFALKLLDLQEDIEHCFGERLTPRQIDRLLLEFTARDERA
jgi:hypothetical protein